MHEDRIMSKNKSQNLTIIDIAKLSGVGKSTVSRVINNETGVNPATREKVLKTISVYNFTPSKSARMLRGYSNKVVGIVVTRLDSSAENEAVRAMLPLLYENEIECIIVESQFSSNKVLEQIAMLESRQVDALVIFAFTGLDISLLSNWNNRLIVIARSIPNAVSICYDDVGAVTTLLNYLHHKKKNEKISFIGVEESDHTTGLLRYQAYKEFCYKNNIAPNYYLDKLSYQTGYKYAKDVIEHGATAIICATDTIALGLNRYLQEYQKDDITVASVGWNELLHFLFPKTISVKLGFYTAGKFAAQELIKIPQQLQAKTIVVPSKLFENKTV